MFMRKMGSVLIAFILALFLWASGTVWPGAALSVAAASYQPGPLMRVVAAPTTATKTDPGLILLPPAGPLDPDAPLEIQVVMTGTTDLAGLELDLVFDPTFLDVTAITPNASLGDPGDCDPQAARCARSLGPMAAPFGVRVGVYAFGNGPGSSGDGVVALLRLQPTGKTGATVLSASTPIMANRMGERVAVESETISLVFGEESGFGIYLPAVLHSQASGTRVEPSPELLLNQDPSRGPGSQNPLTAYGISRSHRVGLASLSPDVNGDGQVDVVDIVLVAAHLGQVAADSNWIPGYDLDGDQTITVADVEIVAGRWQTGLARMTGSSPTPGEIDVAVTRETILSFNLPIDPASVTPETFSATFAGQELATRVHLAPNNRTVTLFYADPLPASARIRVTVDGGALLDANGFGVDVDGDNRPGGIVQIDFDTLSLTVIPDTVVCGKVIASELAKDDQGRRTVDMPLNGATITVDGQEEALFARTDANGDFCLDPAPAGKFFVHVDGRTATNNVPAGAYYPFVGKPWTSTPGQQVDVGIVHLPLVQPGTLQPVSAESDTMIHLAPSVLAANPDFADVSITVPANSLYANDGSRGGKVGIAPVPPDRLPGNLPLGLDFPVVITVQTDGATNFDTPAPVCFPNLDAYLPGDPVGLYSFNHDTGEWSQVGPASVSEDGTLICSDPGVGVLAPGWHGTRRRAHVPMPRIIEEEIVNCSGGVTQCQLRCADDVRTCAEKKSLSFQGRYIVCEALYKVEGLEDFEAYGECISDFPHLELEEKCKNQGFACTDRCLDCDRQSAANGPALASRLPSASQTDPVQEIIQNAAELIRPYVQNGTEIPLHVIESFIALMEQADTTAGGDAVQYMRALTLADEQRNLPQRMRTVQGSGNAPPYPVRYAAEFFWENELHTLRGRTKPYGDYQIFLPRDAQLLSVTFYDPGYSIIESLVVTPQELSGTNRDCGLVLLANFKTKCFAIVIPFLGDQAQYNLPPFQLLPMGKDFVDRDRDGLPDLVERVIGSNSRKPDTDGDGVLDGAEVLQGTNPLDGLEARTGIVASVATPGEALDLCAVNDLVVVADGESGIVAVDVSAGANPIIIAQLDSPGSAQRIACSGAYVAVADGDAGLAIVDVTDPPAAYIRHQVALNGKIQAVLSVASLAYVGSDTGQISLIDMVTGDVLDQISLSGAVNDLGLEGTTLYALLDGTLQAISTENGVMTLAGSSSTPFITQPNGRLFIGGGVAYTVHGKGYNTLDLSVPGLPELIRSTDTQQFGWKDLALNGSGLGLAVTGPNTAGPPRDVALFNTKDPTRTDEFITLFETPGLPNAVAIYNGLAYVADGQAGLQTVNYLAYDGAGNAPEISLSINQPQEMVQEGQLLRVTATVTDDVQVRNVIFLVDGQQALTDGSYPFELDYIAPLLAQQGSVTVQAIASDTGGNAMPSSLLTLTLTADAVAPQVILGTPAVGGSQVGAVTVYFSEPMKATTINPQTIQLTHAGNDGQLDTADDRLLDGGMVVYRPDVQAATLSFPATPSLADGLYGVRVAAEVADLAGNPLGNPHTWTFRVANSVSWISENSGSWHDGANWSTGRAPVPGETVFIDVSGEIQVTYSQGDNEVAALFSAEDLILSGGALKLGEAIFTGSSVTLTGGTLQQGRLIFAEGGRRRIRTEAGLAADAGRLIVTANANNRLEAMTVLGDIDLSLPQAELWIAGGLTFSGALNQTGTGANLYLVDSQQISGGRINMGDGSSTHRMNIVGGAGTVVTFTAGTEVRAGAGTINGPTLVNQGSLLATIAGQTLRIATDRFVNTGTAGAIFGSTLWLDADWQNDGSLLVDDATLTLDGTFRTQDIGNLVRIGGVVNVAGEWDNSGSQFQLDADTGSWRLHAGTLRGGSLTLVDGANLSPSDNTANRVEGLTVSGNLRLSESRASLRIAQGMTVTGALEMNGSGSQLFFMDSQHFVGGTIRVGRESNARIHLVGAGTELILDPNTLLQGGPATIFGNQATHTLVNRGRIAADMPNARLKFDVHQFTNQGEIQILDGAELELNGGWTNAGAMTLDDGTLTLGGAFTTQDIGTIVRNGGVVNVAGEWDNSGNQFQLDAGTGDWRLNAGTLRGGSLSLIEGANLSPSDHGNNQVDGLTINGNLQMSENSARLRVAQGLTLTGELEMSGNGAQLSFVGSQRFAGGVINVGQSSNNFTRIHLFDHGTQLTLAADAVLRGGASTILGSLATHELLNLGQITADVPGTRLKIDSTKFTNHGAVQALNGGFLAFDGEVTDAGLLVPGLAATPLNVTGNYTQTAAGTLAVTVGGPGPGSGYSQMNVSGNVGLNGTLVISMTNGYSPEVGETLQILTYASHQGSFSQVDGLNFAVGKKWALSVQETQVTLEVVADP